MFSRAKTESQVRGFFFAGSQPLTPCLRRDPLPHREKVGLSPRRTFAGRPRKSEATHSVTPAHRKPRPNRRFRNFWNESRTNHARIADSAEAAQALAPKPSECTKI